MLGYIRSHLKLTIGLLVVLLVVGTLGFRLFGQKSASPEYQTAQAENGTLITSVSASGLVNAGNSIDITSQATGVVNSVYVEAGDEVTQGQKIADLELDQNSQQKLAASWASYLSAANTLQSDQNNIRAEQASLEKTLDDIHLFQYGNGGFANVGSASETETQKMQRTSAEVALSNAQNSANTAQAQVTSAWLSYQLVSPTVTAPISGTITNLTLTEGLVVSGGTSSSSNSSSDSSNTSSQKLGTITINQSNIQAVVNLSEVDIPTIQVGQKATLTLDAFANRTFTGKVATIDTNGVTSSGVTTYPVIINIDPTADRIYPNMAVNASIITKVKDNALLIPNSAVQSQNGQTTVRVLTNGQLSSVDITVGDSNDTSTEITSGLIAGQTVVTGASATASRTGASATSPFGAFGGGGRGFGGGGGNAVFIQRGGRR
jgi:RND family efflux transporter MFP subunit